MRPLDPGHVISDVGRRVAELRRGRDWTQERLAEEAEVSLKYLQRVEAGRENLTVQSLVKLANLLHASMLAFFERPRSRGRPMPGRPPKNKKA
jgi:transcriptional regulator with XRE-family HTH domain